MEHVYKMYSIVLRQLDGINNGVQTTHGVCEYVKRYWDTPSLQKWITQDKTLVILNGGTYPNMCEILNKLHTNKVKYETFQEEDLGNLVTSITILADERVWDRENYPLLENWYDPETDDPESLNYGDYDIKEKNYISLVGGYENFIYKEILNNLRTI